MYQEILGSSEKYQKNLAGEPGKPTEGCFRGLKECGTKLERACKLKGHSHNGTMKYQNCVIFDYKR